MERKVSVVIPTYNREETLARAIESVINQTYKNWELLVIDDGSTDNTQQMVQEQYLEDERIKYFKIKNSGANAARNYGIKRSTGDMIAFNDSDDEWLKNKLSEQINFLEKNNYEAVFCQMRVKRTNNNYLFPTNLQSIQNIRYKIFSYNYIGTPSILLKKEIIKDVGLFDESFPRFQDWDFAIRLCNRCNIGFLEENLVNVYMGMGSITATDGLLEEAVNKLFHKYKDDIHNLPAKYREKTYLKIARFYIKSQSFRKAKSVIKLSQNLSKEKILTIIFYIYEKVKKRLLHL